MAHRLALVGCGAVSSAYYVPACLKIPDCEIEWFVDNDQRSAKRLAESYGHGKTTTDYRQTVADVDSAIIALPNYLHAEVSLHFLARGRNVLCEKPIATNSADATKMIEASEESQARLAVNLVRRRQKGYQFLKSLLGRTQFADIRQVECQEGRIFNWPATSASLLDKSKAGGGVMLDWGTHLVDILQWLFNGDLSLEAYSDDGLGRVEANCEARFRVKTKDLREVSCVLALSRTRKLGNNMVLRGKEFSFEIRQSDPNGVYFNIEGCTAKLEDARPDKSTLNCFIEQIENFLDVSSDDICSGRDALKSLGFIESCYSNRQDIRYPWETPPRSNLNLTFPSRYRTVLVAGASGFLGTRLTERLSLDLNLKVRATIHRAQTATRLGRLPVEFIDCDILDLNQVLRAVEGCDVVINCTRDDAGDRNHDIYEIGTSNLLKAAQKGAIKKFIHISTAAVHGFGPEEKLVEENSRIVFTLDPYLRGKIKAEKLVASYASALPVVVLRPTLIYGPYSADWASQIVQRVRNGRTTIVGDKGVANLIYIDDVVDAILLAIERPEANGEIFIITNDSELVLWKDYVTKYSELLAIHPKVSSESNLLLQRLRNLFTMLKDSVVTAKDVANSSETLALVGRIPIVLKLGQTIIRGNRKNELEYKLKSTGAILRPTAESLYKYETIDHQLYNLFTSRRLYSAKKARRTVEVRITDAF